MNMDRKLHNRIIEKKKELDKLRPFPKSALKNLREQIIIEWTYNSDAIEGNSLTLRETRLVLEDGLTISGKSLREHLETINHKEAIEFVEKLIKKSSKINCHAIREIHSLILSKIDDKEAGKYRDVKIFISGSKHIFPEAIEVPMLMSDFDKWLKGKKGKGNILEYAAEAHFKLVDIHPFIDGNGRTARLLMNLILMKYGFPPAVVLKVDRKKYYNCLEKGRKGDLVDFLNFIGRSIERSLTMWLEMLKPANKQNPESKYKPIREIYKNTPYSQEYLSLLARRGKLEAVKYGRNWHTSREAIKKYMKDQKKGKL
ncbi:MAG: Fic family protein [Candidatus Aadella gelida]|nr:Fic family protein [Candidatus Aadella gelida]